jgi:hypothetical protein
MAQKAQDYEFESERNIMELNEIIPVLHDLPRDQKIKIVQILSADLAGISELELYADAAYPIWSPYDAVEAAATLEDYHRKHPRTE